MFQPFQTLQVQLHKPTFCIVHSQNFTLFSILFYCSSSKFTTTTAQLPFYNCKLHFTTAQIVISCTLKYALVKVMLCPQLNYLYIQRSFRLPSFLIRLNLSCSTFTALYRIRSTVTLCIHAQNIGIFFERLCLATFLEYILSYIASISLSLIF